MPSLTTEDIAKLFAVLQARYGHKWTTAYDDPDIMRIAVREWHRALSGFGYEDIRRGLETWADAWPPTLPEFVDACMPPLYALGFDVDAEVRRREPSYYYVADNAAEESRRRRRCDEIRADVIVQLQQQARQLVATVGLAAALEAAQDKRTLLEKLEEPEIE